MTKTLLRAAAAVFFFIFIAHAQTEREDLLRPNSMIRPRITAQAPMWDFLKEDSQRPNILMPSAPTHRRRLSDIATEHTDTVRIDPTTESTWQKFERLLGSGGLAARTWAGEHPKAAEAGVHLLLEMATHGHSHVRARVHAKE